MRRETQEQREKNKKEKVSDNLDGEYKNNNVYIGVAAIIIKDGWARVVNVPLSEEEQSNFDKSCKTITENFNSIVCK